jgi:hypothetical protein
MNFRRMVWTAAILVSSSASVLAQGGGGQGGGSIGTPSTQGGQSITTLGSNATTSSGLPSTTNTGATNTTSSSSNGLSIPGASNSITGGLDTTQNQFQLAAIKQPPSMTNTNNSAIAASNFLRNSYGAVYYQGADRSQVPNRITGSFGTAIYPATGTGGTGGTRGTQGAAVGRAGTGGTLTDPGGQIVTLPRQIAYTSQIQFKNPAGNAMPQLQTDLRSAINRIPADMLANPAGVQVSVDGRNVTLKGNVKDDEESRLVEGLVRLTPGVFSIKNELTIAK